MNLTLEMLKPLCPEVAEPLICQHLKRLQASYFQKFSPAQIAEHLRHLSDLSYQSPVAVSFEEQPEAPAIACTIYAFDYPYGLALITGVLAATGFSIRQGEVFTYDKTDDPQSHRRRSLYSPKPRNRVHKSLSRRLTIDHFVGIPDPNLPLESWENDFTQQITAVLKFVESGQPEALNQARQRVNESVVRRLEGLHLLQSKVLYPITIEIDGGHSDPSHLSDKGSTRLKIVSQDTPAFLYSLSTALSLNGLSIEHVHIHTDGDCIEDVIDLVETATGRPIAEEETLNRLKLSVLLTKHFTHFLANAPDSYSALNRFEYLLVDVLKHPESAHWAERLSDPETLSALAQLLGTSDYMWEDFIRLQYENLLPLLPKQRCTEGAPLSDPTTLAQRLRDALDVEDSFEGWKRALNTFKDREIYLIDLDHILNPAVDFRVFAERLTLLAEQILTAAAEIIYARLVERYGKPRTVAGLEASYALLGLGKLGGAALGYASDVELLLIYSDNGSTEGSADALLPNSEFFSQLIRELTHFIQAKREGIFHIDLRLRPYGDSGPLACSLESFCRYYGPGGDAHAYEKLALVRLRKFGGSSELGAQVERLRDEYLYVARDLDLKALRELRAKQYAQKTRPGSANAKFSPGALVDLEYAVQILQVFHGVETAALRTPRIHKALKGLEQAGVLNATECCRLTEAYDFLRRLINGLRMLRGSALDLFLPPVDSDEFRHLARRMGYVQATATNSLNDSIGRLEPERQLFVEFETRTAAVRTFVEQHFGRDSLPGAPSGNVADLLLASDLDTEHLEASERVSTSLSSSDGQSEALKTRILIGYGFKQPRRAYHNLLQMVGVGPRRESFIKLAVLACDLLRREPDPDMALNNWERFIQAIPDPGHHYRRMLSQPRQLGILLGIFARSQFLADTLIHHPEWFDWVAAPNLRPGDFGLTPGELSSESSRRHASFSRERLECELRAHPSRRGGAIDIQTDTSWLTTLRRFRKREMLRIGTRDMCLGYPLRHITSDLSILAEAITQVALERIQHDLTKEGLSPFTSPERLEESFCILAFGKLGGSELNYSSDIDLIGVFDGGPLEAQQAAAPFFATLMERLRTALSTFTTDGHVYRIDYRLRPYGRDGALAYSLPNFQSYYHDVAVLWEIQALLKLRPIAGYLPLGNEAIDALRPLLLRKHPRADVVTSIHKMREQAVSRHIERRPTVTDVKSGIGGIRDVEFLVQGLQLIHAHRHPDIITGNTLEALSKLEQADILSSPTTQALRQGYSFLRRVEHYLQILDDRQNHTLPQDSHAYEVLAKRILGYEADGSLFQECLQQHLNAIRNAYREHLSFETEP